MNKKTILNNQFRALKFGGIKMETLYGKLVLSGLNEIIGTG
jgi:hypothetical protein